MTLYRRSDDFKFMATIQDAIEIDLIDSVKEESSRIEWSLIEFTDNLLKLQLKF